MGEMGEEGEQLDFEAEEEREEGECAGGGEGPKDGARGSKEGTRGSKDGAKPSTEGGLEEGEDGGELEEGEWSEEGEARPEETEPRPVCRFFSRGQCTWGSSCRYLSIWIWKIEPLWTASKVFKQTLVSDKLDQCVKMI